MKRWIKNSKKGTAVLVAVAFMLMAGWQFGVSGTEVVFSETEVALANAVEGSGSGQWVCCQSRSLGCHTIEEQWFKDDYTYLGSFCP